MTTLCTFEERFVVITVLVGAASVVHSTQGLFGQSQDLQFALFALFALVLLLWRGSGTFSMDYLLRPGSVTSEA